MLVSHVGTMLSKGLSKNKRIAIVTAALGIIGLFCFVGYMLLAMLFEGSKGQILLQACGNGHVATVAFVLDSGVSADFRDGWNTSCMFMAAGNDHADVVRLLLERGEDIDTQYRMDKTALIVGAQAGHLDVVQYLIREGANWRLRDVDGKTALDHALVRAVPGRDKEYDQIIELLGKMD